MGGVQMDLLLLDVKVGEFRVALVAEESPWLRKKSDLRPSATRTKLSWGICIAALHAVLPE